MKFTPFKKDKAIAKCLQCSADVFGREGRKFCCDKCRYKHKNDKVREEKDNPDTYTFTVKTLDPFKGQEPIEVPNDAKWDIKLDFDEPDKVNPSHYKGEIECIDAIRSSMTKEAFLGYLKGNILKYLWRYENKNGKEDLQKAEWYNQKLIQSL